MTGKQLRLIALVLITVFLTDCSKSGQAPQPSTWAKGTFLDHQADLKEQAPAAPFRWVWAAPDAPIAELRKSITKVMVTPVDVTAVVEGDGGISSASADEAGELGELFRDKIIESLKAAANLELQLTDTMGSGTFVLETALLELRPTKAVLNAATSVAGFFIPGAAIATTAISAGASAATGALAKGSIGIGIKIINGDTREAIVEAADREDDSSALLMDFKSFSQYAHTRETLGRWARNVPWLFDPSSQVEQKSGMKLLSMW